MSPEVAVSISDLFLAAFSGWLAVRLQAQPTEKRRTRQCFGIVLGAIAISSLLGAISHGLVPEEAGNLGALIWRGTLMMIGPAAIGLWMLASLLLFRPGAVERARALALLVLAVYIGVVFFEYHEFQIALLLYLPATLALLAAFLVHWRQGHSFAADGVWAMVLTLVAGLLQYFKVDLHPVYFNHNAVYHAVQAVSLFFFYRAGNKWISGESKDAVPVKARVVA